MVQLFVRGAGPSTTAVDVSLECDVSGLMDSIEEYTGIPVSHQGLVYAGRQLDELRPIHSYGITAGSTVQLVYRLLGGKGGFGALLRGMARDGKVTDNYDACRDLQGRRLRHKHHEEKLAAWKAQAKDRELEAIALKHIKEEAKKARQAKELEVDVEAIRSAQEEAITRTQKAVQDALGAATNTARGSGKSTTTQLPPSDGGAAAPADAEGSSGAAGASHKRKAQDAARPAAAAPAAAPPAKKSKMLAALEDFSSEESSDDEASDK